MTVSSPAEEKEQAEQGTVILTVSGWATIHSAAVLKGQLVDAIRSAAAVEVDVSGVTRADASFFQLLCSAHRTALATGKIIRLSAARSDDFLSAAAAVGFGLTAGSCSFGCCIF